MSRSRDGARSALLVLLGVAVGLSLLAGAGQARAGDPPPPVTPDPVTDGPAPTDLATAGPVPPPAAAAPSPRSVTAQLALEVVINGFATNKITEFTQRGTRLLAAASDLLDLGLRVPDSFARTPDRPVDLATLRGVSYRIDGPAQKIYITASNASMLPTLLKLAGRDEGEVTESGVGATLNYDVTGTDSSGETASVGQFDLRLFSPWGVASTGLLGYAGDSPEGPGTNSVVRLDSLYKYSDPDTLRRYNVGDFISGSLSWSRSVRLGGAQVTSDFSLRPDLITFPLPSLSGEAAVPSTVDILDNGGKLLSRDIGAGPFEVPRLPVVTGANTISLSVVNALGKQVEVTLPFYASAALLSPGLQDYSAQVGLVRNDYSILSNDYGDPAGSVTYRRGVLDWLTVEGEAEGTTGTALAGAGVAVNLFNLAVGNVSAAASTGDSHTGTQFSIGAQRSGRVVTLGASATVASHTYHDIAAANGDPVPRLQLNASAGLSLGVLGSAGIAYTATDSDTAARPIDVFVPEGTPVVANGLVVGGTTPIQPARHAHVLTASYSVQVGDFSVFVTASRDFSPGGDSAVLAGVTIPLGSRGSASVSGGAGTGQRGIYGQAQAQQSASTIGDFGYEVFGSSQTPGQAFAQGQYMSPWALLTAGVARTAQQNTYRVEAQGAVSVLDGAVFPSNTVQDSFAVVDTDGQPNVNVLFENREVGETDSSGLLLVPSLLSYTTNRIGIVPTDLPPDTAISTVEKDVRPPDRSGVIVEFPIKVSHGALLHLVDGAGNPLPLGSVVTLVRTGATFPVGYDGEAYLIDLVARDEIEVLRPNGSRCRASLEYRPKPGDIPDIGPIPCR